MHVFITETPINFTKLQFTQHRMLIFQEEGFHFLNQQVLTKLKLFSAVTLIKWLINFIELPI